MLKIYLPALVLFFASTACATTFHNRKATSENFEVKLETCGSLRSEIKVVIFPPTGGATSLEKWYAEEICEQGGFAILVNDWTDAQETALDPELHDRHLQRSLKVYETLERKWKGPFRALGTSLGGLYAAAISVHHPWEKMVLITAGGPLSEVLATSDQKSLQELKAKRMQKWGLRSDKQYEGVLGQAISFDFLPPRFPAYGPKVPGIQGPSASSPRSRVSTDDVLMFIARGDETVPLRTQENLWKALGEPRRIDLSANHFWGIVGTYWNHSSELIDFLMSPGNNQARR